MSEPHKKNAADPQIYADWMDGGDKNIDHRWAQINTDKNILTADPPGEKMPGQAQMDANKK